LCRFADTLCAVMEDAPAGMNTEERLAFILERLSFERRVDTADLTQTLGVSEMTIRRDLARLETDGALRRVRGGATRVGGGSYEPPFLVRTRLRSEQKDLIGRAVAEQIFDGETVVLDGGTTGFAVAQHLLEKVVTVCPLSLRSAGVLVNSPTIRLLLPGGYVRAGEQSVIGPETVQALEQHVYDVFVLTASGVTTRTGVSEWNEDDANVKRAAVASSRRRILACDSSKFGQTAFSRVTSLDHVDLVVTDTGISQGMRAELAELGVEVQIVGDQRDDARAGSALPGAG
jgi:DeoR/GlpR family transcriptional regulator of sugar metabolism